MNWLKDLCLVSYSYMDTEQYEEAVRDYEKVYQTEKTKGGGRADITTSQCSFSTYWHLWTSIKLPL